MGGANLKLDDPQIQHLMRAQELATKAYAEVLAARLPVSSTSPAILNGLSAARNLLKMLLKQAAKY
jgi:hypothetical protein